MTEVEARVRIMTDAGVISDPEWQGRRITDLINESLLWAQAQLLGLQKNYWVTERTAGGIAGGTLQKITGSKIAEAELASDMNWDIPITSLSHADYATGVIARPVSLADWVFVNTNTVLKPSLSQPVFCQVGKDVYLYPALITAPSYLYTRLPATPTYNNNSTALDIPNQYLEMVIERVVMQIKAKIGDLRSKQLSMAEIDSFIQKKYQLTPPDTNRKVTQ